MKRKLRIGIIGTGGIAGAHMAAYKKFNDVEIVGGADSDFSQDMIICVKKWMK